jgi:pimeloyl-ACP methyl ester carboxylesterase
MPEVTSPDGAVIHYEVFGQGYPLLLIAPGGVNSEIGIWQRSLLKPIELFANEFMVIGMDQRYAGQSRAPLKPFSYDDAVGDVLAVLDAVGVERAHIWGGCIGCAYIWRLLRQAPGRFSAAVCQDPVGLDETNSIDVFYRMFHDTMRLARADGIQAVVASAVANPMFVMNNAAGPLARRIAADEAFRKEILDFGRERYVAFVVAFRDGIWPVNPPYFTVSEEWMKTCATPLLIIPGNDPFHPTSVGRKACQDALNARCLDVDARSPEKMEATVASIGEFLKANAVSRAG